MRVLYLLSDGFGGHGGIAQFNRDLLRAICSFPSVSEVIAIPRQISSDIKSLPEKLSYNRQAARGKLRYGASVLGNVIKRGDFDLIICTHLHLQPLAAIARWITAAPLILVIHGIEAWTPPGNRIRRLAPRYADWVVAVSRFTLNHFAGWACTPAARSVVLPCCVDMACFTPGEPASAVLEKYRLRGAVPILSLGRLAQTERYKGFDEVLECLARLRAIDPTIVYVIAGAGDDRARLEAKARDLGVIDSVRFTGYLSDAERVELYRVARAFILAGYGEGFGIVLLEAMACGAPVIASTLDGSFEVIRGGELGIAVDPRNRDALIGGILEALRRPFGKRLANIEYFSYQAFEARAHDVLRRIEGSKAQTTGYAGGDGVAEDDQGQPCSSTTSRQ